jgi:RNA polymerase sigma factor (sigma-70 family)
MGNNQLNAVARHLDLLEGSRDARELSDGQLLERFAVRGEEAAFAALVRRHGPMVLGLCRRVLRHGPDAEDAFQATFLVLFRRARALDRAGSLANWLYTVAYRAALKARADAARRREREGRTMTQARAQSEEIWSDLQPVLDEELNRLPARYRAAVVVCYLQGKTNSEAARLLGCPTGTVKSRLSRARDLLRARLARRGVALSAGLLAAVLAERAAAAAVPRGLVHAAVQTTVLAAAGKALAPAASLAEGVLKAMFVAKVKIAILVLLTLGALFFAAGVWAYQTHPSAERGTGNTEPCDAPRSESRAPGSEDAKKMTVTGRVLDPEGKPVAGAQVTVCVREGMVLSTGQGWASFRNEVLGQVKSDKEGTYRLTVPRANPLMTFCSVRVVAVAANYGLAFKAVEPVAEETEAELRLTTVQRVTGHIVGLQGEDAAGVKIHVGRMKRAPDKGERDDDTYFRPPADLPVSATTDDKGNFVFSGFGPNVTLELEVLDPRYERKTDWTVNTANKKECENIRLLLAPGRYVEGRVVYQDTGKPAAHARLRIFNPIIEVTADADGRFKVPLYTPRDDEPFAFRPRDVTVIAYPPRGEPYQSSSKGVDFPKGVVKREVEFALPRVGVLRGKVTEAGSGKPVEGAYVAYNGDEEQCVVSGADGSFQIGAPAGGGRLLVVHPSGEYIPQVVGSGGGLNDKAVGEPYYYHAVVDVQVKKDEKVTEANVTLRRGVTVKGRLLGADDKPVDSAVMFVAGGHRPRYENTMHPVLVRAGAFDVRGLDPEKTYRLLFLEHPRLPPNMIVPEAPQNPFQLWMAELLNGKDKRGAIVEVAPKKQGDEPLVVRVAPCGSVKLRFVDGAGKPLAGYSPWVQLVVTPGPPIFKAVEDKTLAAEVITLVGRYGNLQEGEPKTDGEGRVTLQGLIPGATYRIKKHVKLVEDRGEVFKDFSVEAGKTAEVEIVVK